MSMSSFLLLAVLKVLAPLPGAGSVTAEATPEELQAFAAADRTLGRLESRHRLWRNYLALMGLSESAPSTSATAFSLRAGESRYFFNVYGELAFDGRFIREDELGALEALERIFREMLAQSKWRDVRFLTPGEGLLFRGFEDSRFAAWDGTILAVAAEKRLPPRILKSLLLETGFAAYGRESADRGKIAATAAALVRAGAAGGRFVGWHRALAVYRGETAADERGTFHCGDFAARVLSRDADREVFVPVLAWK